MTQHLRQLGHAELAGSTRAVGERGEPDAGLLVAGLAGHEYLPCVTPELVEILTALMLGFLHALEVDHMLAVTTFVAGRPSLATAARFGFRWGVGHSLAVLAFGGVLLATGIQWPERFDAFGEGVVGVMLIGLGLWALGRAGSYTSTARRNTATMRISICTVALPRTATRTRRRRNTTPRPTITSTVTVSPWSA